MDPVTLAILGLLGYVVINWEQVNRNLSVILPEVDGGSSIPDISFSIGDGGFNIGFDASQTDIDTLARTAWAEGRGGGLQGMQAVMNCVMNRYADAQGSTAYGQLFGYTVSEICKKPAQFSCWNVNGTAQEIANHNAMLAVTENDKQFSDALKMAELAINGALDDITGGAEYYRGYGGSLPSNAVVTAIIGGNKYFYYA